MKIFYIALGCLQALTAIGAIPAGLMYLMDISGESMGTTPAILSDTPFKSFLIPGLFLVLVNGIGQTAGAYVSFKLKPFAGIFGLALGIILIIWIIMQVYWIGLTHFLQPFFFVVGFVEALLSAIIFFNAEHKDRFRISRTQ